MRAPPTGWPRISSSIFYDDARGAISFLQAAFGFESQLVIDGPGGRIEHAQLIFGGGKIMIGQTGSGRANRRWLAAPRDLGGANTQTMAVFVDDVDAHCERARAAGATIAAEPKTEDYGPDYWCDRGYEAVDPEGHHWFFMQRLRG